VLPSQPDAARRAAQAHRHRGAGHARATLFQYPEKPCSAPPRPVAPVGDFAAALPESPQRSRERDRMTPRRSRGAQRPSRVALERHAHRGDAARGSLDLELAAVHEAAPYSVMREPRIARVESNAVIAAPASLIARERQG